ncbi:MAG: efflux transporter outer membrane subunit [Acidobacteria bacterium]|nr:efflux transporter outer membrane subunit [Acidobacteriota bacterium]MYK80383.1 efflux transporter outer membrane subunit [Acidobacteriota bacterium]
MKVGRRTALAVACVLASGCGGLRVPVVDPEVEFTPEPEAPETTGSTAAPAADWWTSFGDPALDRVVERALSGNLTLREAAARLAQAAADAGIARSALYPQVGAGVDRLQARQAFIGLPISDIAGSVGLPIPGLGEDEVLTTDFVRYGLSLDLTWEANLWRAATPRARAANAVMEAAVAEVAGARVSLAGQAARLYFLAVEAREQARIADEVAASREETVRWTRERARIGEAALAEVNGAEARLAEARAAAASRRQARAAAVRGLEVLFTDYPDGEPGPDWELGGGLPPAGSAVPAGAPADLISRRPDVASAERRLAMSQEFTEMARRARYPQFPLTSSVGTASTRLRQLVNGDFSVWSLIARIAAPVFQGGRIRAQIRQEEARDREALAVYARTVLTAYQEVEAALSAEESLQEMESRSAEALSASRRALSRTRSQRRGGFGTRLMELEAERAVLMAESGHLSQVRARLDNRVNLSLALGGGFERTAGDETADAGER